MNVPFLNKKVSGCSSFKSFSFLLNIQFLEYVSPLKLKLYKCNKGLDRARLWIRHSIRRLHQWEHHHQVYDGWNLAERMPRRWRSRSILSHHHGRSTRKVSILFLFLFLSSLSLQIITLLQVSEYRCPIWSPPWRCESSGWSETNRHFCYDGCRKGSRVL